MIDEEADPAAMAQAQELLTRFMGDRSDRTRHAYTIDLDEFARFLDTTPTAAVAWLLTHGSSAGRRVALEYAIDLRRRDRAQATIERRLGTLRALVRTAHDLGAVEWGLDVPSEGEISAAMETLPAKDSEHYLFPRHPGEVDRLDIQHYALRETLHANYLAPVEDPQRVLDVGCGTGQWGFEMCREFATALGKCSVNPSNVEQRPKALCYGKADVGGVGA
jgi:SAM-dependent methyltransferase